MQNPLCILVIDDDEDITELFAAFLERAGYAPVVSGDGEHGFKVAKVLRPALILCDAYMPRMDGCEVVRRLKAAPETARIPVILMSGHDRTSIPDSPADDFIAKPFQMQEAMALLSRLILQSRGRAKPTAECIFQLAQKA